MAKRTRKPRSKDREIRHWRHRSDEELLGRSTYIWQNAESLSPGPRTIQDAADGARRALEIVYSYRLLVPIIRMTVDEYAAACSGSQGVAL
jgi:hypothetical protein